MGSDRARISYDPKQHYRSVVMQQGRVTVEADWNEAQLIASEETRVEALDFVGPAGTPDDGYAITGLPPGFDFEIGPGSMYVGGVRAFLPKAEAYSKQSDWLDFAIDPDWVKVPKTLPTTNEYVYLLLREQEVSGVEDSDLKDVALGGPDTAQRTRLIQHVERLATTGTDCASALAAAETTWAAKGFAFNPNNMRVRPFARMQVKFVTTGTSTPCDPTAQGGYLGADNQLIRVQISNADSGALRLLWGFDDASFLYRVTVDDPTHLTLQTAPVDAEHVPQGGQAVEVLMDAAVLANGQYVAAPVGQVFTLATSSYNTDSRILTLPSGLNPVYGDGTTTNPGPPQVYLRVWSQELPFTPGTPVTLGDTGIQVTLTSINSEPFRVGDFWMFAVRPGTPQQVYPERYLAGPQPPDGPREWICPLAVIIWSASPPTFLSCRNPFDNLVALTRRKLGGCCTVNVSPSDLTGTTTLQTIVDKFSGLTGVNVCFAPGLYTLTDPLVLESKNSHLHFEACAGGVVFAAAAAATAAAGTAGSAGAGSAFLQGLVVLNSVDDVSFDGIQFQLPLVEVNSNSLATASVSQTPITFSIGIRMVNSTNVNIENCQFEFSSVNNTPLLGVGILAAGECTGFELVGNTFEMPLPGNTGGQLFPGGRSLAFTTGFAMFPTTISNAIRTDALVASGAVAQVVAAELQRAEFRDNQFSGLTLCTFVYADAGLLEVEANTVQNCVWGFWFLTLPAMAFAANAADIATAAPSAANIQALPGTITAALENQTVQFAAAMLRGFPLPQNVDLTKAISVTVRKPVTTLNDPTLLQTAFDRIRAIISGTPAQAATDTATLAAEAAAAAAPASGIATLNQNFNIIEKLAFPAKANAAIPLAMHVSNNDVSTPEAGVLAGLGMLLWDLGTNDQDAVSMNGNTFVCAGVLPAVFIAGVSRNMFTGNMVLNEGNGDNRWSLLLFPVAVADSTNPQAKVFAATVTGNVFRGPAVLPARNLSPTPPPPMDTWHFFNSET